MVVGEEVKKGESTSSVGGVLTGTEPGRHFAEPILASGA